MLHFRIINEENHDLPPLILIHGLFGSLENLTGLARVLAPFYKVYALDLPNHGRSSHVSGGNLVLMAELLGEWMDSQGLSSANFVGHSLGGKVAMEFALLSPERVQRLVVMDIAPVKYPPSHTQVFAGLFAINPLGLSARAEADEVLLRYVPELAVRTFLLKNLVRENNVFRWRMNLEDLYQNYSYLLDANRKAVFQGQTVFVKAGNSDYIKEAHRSEIIQRFPHARLKIIPNTGHWLHAEKPDIVAKTLLRALTEN